MKRHNEFTFAMQIAGCIMAGVFILVWIISALKNRLSLIGIAVAVRALFFIVNITENNIRNHKRFK